MSAGVFTLTEANEKAVENTWESVDNVWIFLMAVDLNLNLLMVQ